MKLSIQLFLLIIFMLYILSFHLYVFDRQFGSEVVSSLFSVPKSSILLFPNMFFITGVLAFISKVHVKYLKTLFILWIVGTVMSSLWWLWLNGDEGNIIILIYKYAGDRVYIQELQSGYYLWFCSMFIGFSIILFQAVEDSVYKQYYLPVLLFLVLALGGSFSYQWSKSKIGFLKYGLEDLNVGQLNRAMANGAKLSWESSMVMSDVIDQYDSDNLDEVM